MSTGLAGAIKRATMNIASSARNHDAWAIRLVFFAGVITILHKAGAGGLDFGIPPYAVVFAVCLGIAALLYEMNAARYALRAFWKGRAFGAIGWTFIWVVAFAYSMNQWVGAASESEVSKSNVHKAAVFKTRDARQELAEAETGLKVAREKAERISRAGYDAIPIIDGVQVTSVTQAKEIISGLENHRWFAGYTDKCTKPRGRDSQAFCDKYRAARAALARAEKADEIQALLPAATAAVAEAQVRLDKARSSVGTAGTEVSESRGDLLIMTRYGGLSEEDARVLNALGSIIAISIFLSLATALREMESLRNEGPRRPLFRWREAWSRIMHGSMSAEAPEVVLPRASTSPVDALHERIRYAVEAQRSPLNAALASG